MKALHERDDFALSGIRQPREFQRRLICFGPAVAEKCAPQTRRAHEALAENSLRRMIKKIRDVQQLFRSILQRLHQPRMLMAENVDGDAAEKVPVDVTIGVDQPRSSARARMK